MFSKEFMSKPKRGLVQVSGYHHITGQQEQRFRKTKSIFGGKGKPEIGCVDSYQAFKGCQSSRHVPDHDTSGHSDCGFGSGGVPTGFGGKLQVETPMASIK